MHRRPYPRVTVRVSTQSQIFLHGSFEKRSSMESSLFSPSSSSYSSLFTAKPTRLLSPKPKFTFSIRSSIEKPKPKLETNSSKSQSWVSPDWLTTLTRTLSSGKNDESGIPIANAKLDDVADLLGGALFLPLYKWMNEYGPIYRLAAGPRSSL